MEKWQTQTNTSKIKAREQLGKSKRGKMIWRRTKKMCEMKWFVCELFIRKLLLSWFYLQHLDRRMFSLSIFSFLYIFSPKLARITRSEHSHKHLSVLFHTQKRTLTMKKEVKKYLTLKIEIVFFLKTHRFLCVRRAFESKSKITSFRKFSSNTEKREHGPKYSLLFAVFTQQFSEYFLHACSLWFAVVDLILENLTMPLSAIITFKLQLYGSTIQIDLMVRQNSDSRSPFGTFSFFLSLKRWSA